MKKQIILLSLIFFSINNSYNSYAQNIGITGVIDWEKMEIRSAVSLDLQSANLRLPSGRTQAEYLLADNFKSLIRGAILDIQVDSSSKINDLHDRYEINFREIDAIAGTAVSVPPSLSPDMTNISAAYSIPVTEINKNLQKHSRPSPVSRALIPATAISYTGIIIIASEALPAHGMRRSFLPVPCLFPKIWDSEMNLIYDRTMVQPRTVTARYSSPENILYNSPSGLSPELQEIAGDRPLRIFARGVFGTKPTDLIIDRTDALQIISSEHNRSLLTQGKVVIILDESVLREEFSW